MQTIDYLVTFILAYIQAAIWTHGPHGRQLRQLSEQAQLTIAHDCTGFLAANWRDLHGLSPQQAGHDFWLTRNRHGGGFWDRALGQQGQRLTRAAKAYGECWLYVGDDGLLHLHPDAANPQPREGRA